MSASKPRTPCEDTSQVHRLPQTYIGLTSQSVWPHLDVSSVALSLVRVRRVVVVHREEEVLWRDTELGSRESRLTLLLPNTWLTVAPMADLFELMLSGESVHVGLA